MKRRMKHPSSRSTWKREGSYLHWQDKKAHFVIHLMTFGNQDYHVLDYLPKGGDWFMFDAVPDLPGATDELIGTAAVEYDSKRRNPPSTRSRLFDFTGEAKRRGIWMKQFWDIGSDFSEMTLEFPADFFVSYDDDIGWSLFRSWVDEEEGLREIELIMSSWNMEEILDNLEVMERMATLGGYARNPRWSITPDPKGGYKWEVRDEEGEIYDKGKAPTQYAANLLVMHHIDDLMEEKPMKVQFSGGYLLNPQQYLERARQFFCTPKDESRFIQAMKDRKINIEKNGPGPWEVFIGRRYERKLSGAEYREKVSDIQEKVKEFLEKSTGYSFSFDPLLPRHAFFTDDQGRDRRARLGKLLSRLGAPVEIAALITQFPPKVGKDIIIEISTDPIDILTKSTGRSWELTSCERLGAGYDDGPFSDIANNNAMALFYRHGKSKPFGRIMLRWCIDDDNELNIGVEPLMYPPSALNFSIRSELVALLREHGFVNYDSCTTPYYYEGYSDRIRGSGRITYSGSMAPLSEVMKKIEEAFANAVDGWTGVDWDVPFFADEAVWETAWHQLLDVVGWRYDELDSYEQYEILQNRVSVNTRDLESFLSDIPLESIGLGVLLKTLGGVLKDDEWEDEWEDAEWEHNHYNYFSRKKDIEWDASEMKDIQDIIEENWPDEDAKAIVRRLDVLRTWLSGILISEKSHHVYVDKYEEDFYLTTEMASMSESDLIRLAIEKNITYESAVSASEEAQEIVDSANSARAYGTEAVEQARAGNWAAAIEAASEASRIENQYGDDPAWGPLLQAISEAS